MSQWCHFRSWARAVTSSHIPITTKSHQREITRNRLTEWRRVIVKIQLPNLQLLIFREQTVRSVNFAMLFNPINGAIWMNISQRIARHLKSQGSSSSEGFA